MKKILLLVFFLIGSLYLIYSQKIAVYEESDDFVRFSSIQNSFNNSKNCVSLYVTLECGIINIIKEDDKLPLLGVKNNDFGGQNIILGIASPIIFNGIEKDENDVIDFVFSPEIPISINKKVSSIYNDLKFFPNLMVRPEYLEFINFNLYTSYPNSDYYYDASAEEFSRKIVGLPRRYSIDYLNRDSGNYFLKLVYDLHESLDGNTTNVGNFISNDEFLVQIAQENATRRIKNIAKNFVYNESNHAIQNCIRDRFDILCHAALNPPPEITLENIIVGYGLPGDDNSFPARTFNQSLELFAYFYLYYNNGKSLKFKTWSARNNYFFPYNRHPRRILEDDLNFTILNEIKSGEEYGHQPNTLFFSLDDSSYSLINYEETLLELYSTETNELINTLDFNSFGDGHFHSLKINGPHLEFISKTSADVTAHKFNDCITPSSGVAHQFFIENDTFKFKVGNYTVWEKSPNRDSITCVFPSWGSEKLEMGQKLIQYNSIPINSNTDVNYLYSADPSGNSANDKITIKDNNVLKVIKRSDFDGSFKNAKTIQQYNL